MPYLHSRALQQVLGNQMLRRAHPDRGIVQLVGLLVDERDKGLDIGRRRVFRHHDHVGGLADHADRREALHRIVGHLLDHHRRHRVTGADREGGVAVIGGLGDDAAGDRATGAGAVFYHELLAEDLRQPLGNDARDNVGSTAGPESDQDANRLVRPVLCPSHRELGARKRQGRNSCPPEYHRCPPRFLFMLFMFSLRSAYAFDRRLAARRLPTLCHVR
jgi:hypothetical protein